MCREKIDSLWASPTRMLSPMISLHGYSLPRLEVLDCHTVGSPDHNNLILCPRGSDWKTYRSHEFQGRNNVVVLGLGANPHGWCKVFGDENVVILGENANPGGGHINVLVRGNQTLAFWGASSTSQNTTIHLQGDKTKVIVGDHCLFSHGISVRSGDDHAILDMKTGLQTNTPKSIYIEPAVWVGPDVTIGKGSHIRFGSIITNRTVVTKEFPKHSLIGGTPATLIREGVMWDEPMVSGESRVVWAREYCKLLENQKL